MYSKCTDWKTNKRENVEVSTGFLYSNHQMNQAFFSADQISGHLVGGTALCGGGKGPAAEKSRSWLGETWA